MNPTQLLGLAFASTALFLASIATPAAAIVDIDVQIAGFTFTPGTTTDDSVTFTNRDPVAHHPVADDGCFDTSDSNDILGLGDSDTVDLSGCEDDEIPYHCEIHGFMTSTLRRV